MDAILLRLFDAQRFYRNRRLEHLINETLNGYSYELNDDELSLVSAAGEIPPPQDTE